MILWRSPVVRFVAAVVLTLAPPLLAQDHVLVARVTASGGTATVPVSVRDMPGTPLGMDRPAGSRIQALSMRVRYSPASSVESVTFSRAGITRNLTPIFETAPGESGSASLIVSFDETSNPIPFTLNGSDVVAQLVFRIAESAAPSSKIAIELDPVLTQLTDSGGTAATKETVANGRLALVDGGIDIPALSVSLSPSSRSIAPGSSGTFEAKLSARAAAETVVTLLSSNPLVASLPSSVTIAAGQSAASFEVTALTLGTTTISAAISGSSDTSSVTVAAAPVVCTTPAAPQISGPGAGTAGVPYNISWTASTDATEYMIEESPGEDFNTILGRRAVGIAASFTQSESGGRRYYRVRARNHRQSCDAYSAYSGVISVVVDGTPVSSTRILPVVGSVEGGFGSYFRTSLQLHNPHDVTLTGRIVFHPAGSAGSPTDPSLAYELAPLATLAFADLLPAMGIASGLGSADVISDPGSAIPAALARVFNDTPQGTNGLGLELLPLDRALESGDRGVLFAPADVSRFRLNIGVRTLAEGAVLSVTVRNASGAVVKTVARTYASTFFRQSPSAEFLDGYVLGGGETITVEVANGAALLYGSTTDNQTNDPSVQIAAPLH